MRKRQLQLLTCCKEQPELAEMHFVLGDLSRDAQEQLTDQGLGNKIMLVNCGSILELRRGLTCISFEVKFPKERHLKREE